MKSEVIFTKRQGGGWSLEWRSIKLAKDDFVDIVSPFDLTDEQHAAILEKFERLKSLASKNIVIVLPNTEENEKEKH
jgi:hypothetical protein